MTDADVLASVCTVDEVQTLLDACKAQILAGGASQAFVVSSSTGGRSVSLQQTYSAWDMLGLCKTALGILTGKVANSRTTQVSFGAY
jgi:hypothetical protein